MKKVLISLLVLFTLASCGNTYYVDGAQLKTITVTVDANDWQYTQQGVDDKFNNNYFYKTIDIPAISRVVFDKGEVKAYLVQDRRSSYYARKHLLPYVLHKEELINNNNWIYYTETVDCTYGIGWVEFNFRASDFAYEENVNINPPTMEFDIVITTPQD